MVWDRKPSRDSGHFWLYLRTAGLLLGRLPWPIFHKSLPLNKLHYCLHGGSTPLIICQGASSSKGIDKEFGGLGQEAIQRFWTFLAVPENSGAFFLAGCPGQFFHKSLPLNKLHYCLHGGSTPLIICQGASSSKGIDQEFGGLGQEAIQRFWTFLAVPENSGAGRLPWPIFSQIPTLKQAALLPSWGFHPLDNLSGCIF